MKDKLYLLVSEGPTDILVINKIAEELSKNLDYTIQIRELSPQRDATTNRYPRHGWKEVRRWCKLYSTTNNGTLNAFEQYAARSKNWKATVELANANSLIIQMDTDIVEYITDIIPNYRGSTSNSRKTFAKHAILDWLGEDTLPNKVYMLLSTSSTETWILATHDKVNSIFSDLPTNFNFEDIQDAVTRLFSLGYASFIDSQTGQEKLTKDLSIYKNYAQQIAINLNLVRLECEEANQLCNEFEQ